MKSKGVDRSDIDEIHMICVSDKGVRHLRTFLYHKSCVYTRHP